MLKYSKPVNSRYKSNQKLKTMSQWRTNAISQTVIKLVTINVSRHFSVWTGLVAKRCARITWAKNAILEESMILHQQSAWNVSLPLSKEVAWCVSHSALSYCAVFVALYLCLSVAEVEVEVVVIKVMDQREAIDCLGILNTSKILTEEIREQRSILKLKQKQVYSLILNFLSLNFTTTSYATNNK